MSEAPQAGQIRNSNTYTLYTQTENAGAEPLSSALVATISKIFVQKSGSGLEHDILLVSGGVSMGKYDLVEDVFAEFGVKVLFDKVAMKPGKPTVFGYRDRAFVFGLPGNPVSTMVAFRMFVRPVILSLLKAEVEPPTLEATLEAPAKCDPERAALVPAMVRFEGGRYRIQTAPWKGSSDLVGLSRANALIVIPQREGMLQPGESAQISSDGVNVAGRASTDPRRFAGPCANGGRDGEGRNRTRGPSRSIGRDVGVDGEVASEERLPKGNPMEVARIAGIQAGKKTSELIPLCHPLPLTHLDVSIEITPTGARIEAVARTKAETGVEMEALTAASVAALTLYDMCKAVEKGISIGPVRLLEKIRREKRDTGRRD